MISPKAEVTSERRLKVWLDWPSRVLFETPVMTETELTYTLKAIEKFLSSNS